MKRSILNRKAARQQARQLKKQRRADNYVRRKLVERREKRKVWLDSHPKILQEIQGKEKNIRENTNKRSKMLRSGVPELTENVHEDPLLAFAERAIEEGILGSDGEFDEEKMNSLFSKGELSSSNEDLNINSDGEKYLNGDTDDEMGPSDSEVGEGDDSSSVESEEQDNFSENNSSSSDEDYESGNGLESLEVEKTKDTSPTTDERLTRIVQGSMNKLTLSNFDAIASSLVEQFSNFPRHDVTEVITRTIMTFLTRQSNLLDNYIMTYASLISAIAHLVGIDFVGNFLEELVKVIDKQNEIHKLDSSKGDVEVDGLSPSRICMNCVTILAYLYNLQVLANLAIIDLIKEAVESLQELEIEVVVKVIRLCGAQLRRDDASSLKEIINLVMERVSAIPEQQKSSRFKFMVEAILDLKNNKQKLVAVQHGELETAKKILRNVLLKSNRTKLDPLQIGLTDIRNIRDKGKWWKIGAAWNPKDREFSQSPDTKVDPNNEQSKIISIARQQKMNTDVRRLVFSVLMTCEDYIDAFQKLLSLKLPSRQEREIVHVLIHCCTHEKAYNPFYSLVAGKFLESRHSFVITFKYTFWDKLQQIESEEIKLWQVFHFAKFYGYLFAQRYLPLNIMKKADFSMLSESIILFFQITFVTIFESAKSDLEVNLIFSALNECKGVKKKKSNDLLFDDQEEREDDDRQADEVDDLKQVEMTNLKKGLQLFFQNYLKNVNSLPFVTKWELVLNRIDLSLAVLESNLQ